MACTLCFSFEERLKCRVVKGLTRRRAVFKRGSRGARVRGMDYFVAEQSAKKAERREIRRALKQTRCTGYTDRTSGVDAAEQPR